ncbi:MAG: hypothetical protein ABL940_08190 [Bacteroidia bacterium]
MSNVTNLILTISTLENEIEKMQQVNSFEYRGLQMNLISVDYNKNNAIGTRWYGGTKFLEAGIYIGAFNHFPLYEFIEHLKKIKWEYPKTVQIIYQEQNDEKFSIIDIEPK